MMTRTTRVVLGVTTTLSLCLLVAGCDSGPGLAPVSGTVTMDGSPLAGAEVTFQPTFEGGSPSSAITDASGRYELKFTMKEKGALPGEHIVRITMAEEEDADEGGVAGAGTTGEEGDEEPSDERIPARYNTESELKRTVEKKSNTFDFPLESGE